VAASDGPPQRAGGGPMKAGGPMKGGGPLGLDGTTMMLLGGFVLLFGMFPLAFLWFETTFVVLCLPTTILPGAVVLAWGAIVYRREQHLAEFASWLKAYRREKVDELARRYGKSRYEFERLLGKAIDRGLVNAVIDRSADEYVSKDVEAPTIFVGRCPECGGDVNKWAFPEEMWTCPYCSQSVTTHAA